jgi:L-iditol 2-dehydrogenase
MSDAMKALEVRGAGEMVLLDVPRPPAGPGEAVVQVAYCGICGSDFPRYFDGAVHQVPQTLGHEFSGVVVDVGPGADRVEPGQRVAVAPLIPCRSCPSCASGRPALCRSYSFVGSRRQGALAEYVSVPASNLVPIPDGVTLRDAALIEPLTVAIHGVDRAKYTDDSRVVVYGAGVIGLLTVMVLKAQNVKEVIAVDVRPEKLALATALGADAAVLGGDLEDFFADHEAPSVGIETAGHPATQVQAVKYCANGGQVVYVGTCTRDVTFPAETFERVLRGELTLTGSWMSYSAPFPGYEWSTAVELIASGAINVDQLVSKVYRLEDGAQPFHDVRDSGGGLLKVLYNVGERHAP